MPPVSTTARGFTVYQLLVSLVVVVILISLGMAYKQSQQTKPATSALAGFIHG
jgi:hypothetical protein